MKILFTILSIGIDDNPYIYSAIKLSQEILSQTHHDLLISTNKPELFNDILNSRLIIRNNIDNTSVYKFTNQFNYNLKHFAFKNIPTSYDYIIYLDCDIKLNSWSSYSENFMIDTMSNYEFGADRLGCYLKDEVSYYINGQRCLFSHKIQNYNILERFSINDDIMNSRLPSEHFLILKNNPKKIIKFQEKWEEQNTYLQNTNCNACAWGDGFEIGISARYAGYHNVYNISASNWKNILGLQFNGNKQ